MMREETGERPKVVGRRMDMAPVGPMPGRTPINVPINTPIKQYKKFTG
jgi:hypothetical protein